MAEIEYDIVDGANGTVTKKFSFSSNTVENLIPGVTIKLLNTTENSAGGFDNLNIRLRNNTQTACEKIISFFKNFNETREILNRNLQADEDGNPLDQKATMFRSPLIRELSQQLDTIARYTTANPASGDYISSQDIGIVLDQSAGGFQAGTYTITSSQTLLSALSNDFDKVKKFFGNYVTVSNDNFDVANLGSLNSSISGTPISVTYSKNGGSFYTNFTCGSFTTGNTAVTTNGYFVGPAGSAFEGITIGYGGTALQDGDSITFTMVASQGLAAQSSIKIERVLDEESGDFFIEFKRIKEQNAKYKEQINKTTKEAEATEKKWTTKAARLDAAREKYSQFQKQLDQMFNNNNK